MTRSLAAAAIVLLLLHTIACLPELLFEPRLSALWPLSPDLLLALGCALLGAAMQRPRLLAHIGSALLVVAIAYDGIVLQWPVYMDSPFALVDLPRLGGLPHLLLDDKPQWLQWTVKIAVVPILLLVQWSLAWLLARPWPAGGRGGMVTWLVALQALLVFGVVRGAMAPTSAPLWRASALGRLAVDVGRELRDAMFTGELGSSLSLPPEAARIAAAPDDCKGLAGADVHVVFVESYGRVALRHPTIGAHLRDLATDLEAQLAAAGFAAMSGAITPAVSGGGSSLAHAELLTGVLVPDYRTVERLLRSNMRPLPRLFADAGYRTVLLMPSMSSNWTQGMAFYGFRDGLSQQELGYHGFRYHFGCMPDQFALYQLLHQFVAPATQPLFTFFVSVTSHLPCTYIPAYVADWNCDPAALCADPLRTYGTSWLNVRTHPDMPAAYRDGLDYALRSIVGFTCNLTRPSLVILLGDHQPPVKGVLVPDDQSADVPFHVLCNRPELLAKFAAFGLLPGLVVEDSAPSFESCTFAPRFLELFSGR